MRLQKAPAGHPLPAFFLHGGGCETGRVVKTGVFAFRGKVVTSPAGLKYLRFVLLAGVARAYPVTLRGAARRVSVKPLPHARYRIPRVAVTSPAEA